MSEHLAAAAAALNAPETIVARSAEARAKATGASIDDILAAWAGGGSAPPAPTPTRAPAPAAQTPPEPAPQATEAPAATPAPPAETPATQPATVAVATVRAEPPILTAPKDRPLVVMIGAVAAMALALLAGLVAGSNPADSNGVYSSSVALTDAGLAGRDIYQSLGCGACHTQMVRPLVIDAGLGGVTMSDSNQVLGSRRIGPDLSSVGVRDVDLAATVQGAGRHPAFSLSDADLSDLVEYLEATNAVPADEETGS